MWDYVSDWVKMQRSVSTNGNLRCVKVCLTGISMIIIIHTSLTTSWGSYFVTLYHPSDGSESHSTSNWLKSSSSTTVAIPVGLSLAHFASAWTPVRPTSEHSGNVQCTFREQSVHIQETVSAHTGNVQCTFRERSLYIPGTFSAHVGNVKRTFRECPVHIQGTFNAHSSLRGILFGAWGACFH
jgi:hypothetical protein